MEQRRTADPREKAASATQAERRLHDRHDGAALAGRVGSSQRFRLLDLGLGGARIETGEALGPGRRYQLQLAGLQLTVEVVRSTLVLVEPDEQGGRPVFEAALAFVSLTPAEEDQLRRAAGTIAVGASVAAGLAA